MHRLLSQDILLSGAKWSHHETVSFSRKFPPTTSPKLFPFKNCKSVFFLPRSNGNVKFQIKHCVLLQTLHENRNLERDYNNQWCKKCWKMQLITIQFCDQFWSSCNIWHYLSLLHLATKKPRNLASHQWCRTYAAVSLYLDFCFLQGGFFKWSPQKSSKC